MPKQRTIKEVTDLLVGIEPYGGNAVNVRIYPAEPNTGIVFTDGKHWIKLEDRYLHTGHRLALAKTLFLERDGVKVRGLEHLTGDIFVHRIDNAVVELKMEPHLSYRLFHRLGQARNTIVVPYFPDLEGGVCRALKKAGIEEQPKDIPYLRLKTNIDTEKIKLEKIKGDEVVVEARTRYALANGDVVEGTRTITLVPEEYNGIANARAFFGVPIAVPEGFTRKRGILHSSFPTLFSKSAMRFIGHFLYLSFGLGTGINEANSFYPPTSATEWKERQLRENEIAEHSIVDRAGDFMERLYLIFNARPAGMKLTCQFAGHKDAHDLIRKCGTEYRNRFYIED